MNHRLEERTRPPVGRYGRETTGTLLGRGDCGGMSEEGDRFRKRARECRDLAPKARVLEVRDQLLRLATELEEEAEKADGEGNQ